jgi:DNA repair protein SbcC/Rad50
LDKLSDRARLIEAIKMLGFGESLFDPPPPLASCDAALRSKCYLAFVILVAPSDSLIEMWLKWQELIAGYRRSTQSIPRDLYLVLLLQAENDSAVLENIDRVTRDAQVCRKIVCVVPSEGYRSAIETWPFLSFASGTLASPRALISVLDGFKSTGYDPQLIDTFSKWISAEHVRNILANTEPPALLPESKLDDYTRTLPVSEEPSYRIRLLKIKDFRGIRKMEIDLSTDLVLIHGRNGTGKTSVFDALEWALLGEVEHIDDITDEGGDRPPFVNLFSEDGVAAVSLQLESDGVIADLARSIDLNGKKSLRFDGKTYNDDRSALIDMLGEQARNLNVGNLRDLTRSSNFLAQATLRRFFSKRPEERYKAVSYLLGTHDYVKFLKKLDDVREEFAKGVAKTEKELSILVQEIGLRRVELQRFTSQLADSPVGAELDARIDHVLSQVAQELLAFQSPISMVPISRPLLFEEVKAFLDVAEQWRSVTSETLDKRLKDLAFLERSAALLRQQEGQSVSTRAELLTLDTREQHLKAELQSDELSRRQLDDGIAGLRLSLQSLSNASVALQRLKELDKSEPELLRTISSYSEQREELTKREQTAQKNRESVQMDEGHLLASKKRVSTEIATLQNLLRMIFTLKGRVSDITRYRDEDIRIQAELRVIETDTAIWQGELATADQEYAQGFAELNVNVKAVEATRSSMERYRNLLSSLRPYLHDPSCPLCGQQYESLDELLRHVDISLGADPSELSRMEKESQTLRNRLKLVSETQDHLRERLATAAANIRSNRRRLSELESSLSEIRKLSQEAGLGDQAVEISVIESRRANIEKQLQDLTAEVGQIEAVYAVRVGEHSQYDSELKFVVEQRNELESKLQRSHQELSQLNLSKSQLVVSSLLSDSETISDRERDVVDQLTRVRQEIAKAEQERAVREGRMSNVQSELSSLGKQKSTKEQQLRALSLETEQLKASTARLNAYDSSTLTEQQATTTTSLDRLKSLAIQIENAKQLISWLVARREAKTASNQIEMLVSQRQKLEESRDRYDNWGKHLAGLSTMISDARHEAENWQLENYGPSVSNLYKRFSAHPIFGNIRATVDPKKEEVRITAEITESLVQFVKHPADAVAPLRYFSEAQANVLALSVFLSNVLQQRWSKMTSVFMDDPVQNMDDLNSNAFIDTIRALTTSVGRQFVMATCDPHLYRLMLVKLSCLNGANGQKHFSAYRLDGISIHGPNLVRDV